MSILNFPQVGVSGAGYIWSVCEGGLEEEWRQSIAPIPADKLAEFSLSVHTELDLPNEDGSILPASGELMPDSGSVVSDVDVNEVYEGDYDDFEKEVIVMDRHIGSFSLCFQMFLITFFFLFYQVEATFLRAVHEVGVDLNNVILEVNSLKYILLIL